MAWYNSVNIVEFLKDQTPLRRRNVFDFSWLIALTSPLIIIYSQFKQYLIIKQKELKYNSSTLVMSNILNDYFDPVLRRIYIVNQSEGDVFGFTFFQNEQTHVYYIYNVSELQTPMFVFNDNEGVQAYDFTVFVPSSLFFDLVMMNSIIMKYKLIYKTFEIKTF